MDLAIHVIQNRVAARSKIIRYQEKDIVMLRKSVAEFHRDPFGTGEATGEDRLDDSESPRIPTGSYVIG